MRYVSVCGETDRPSADEKSARAAQGSRRQSDGNGALHSTHTCARQRKTRTDLQAYDKILLSAFNSRLSGQTSVKKEIKYADRGWNIPWKPRREPASEMDVKINLLASAALAVTAVMRLLSGLEPSVVATVFFVFRMYRKLDPYYIVESEFEDDAPQKTAKLLRAIGVVFGFLAAGICAGGLAYTVVNIITQITGAQVPMWTLTRPTMFVNLGSIAAAFATTFYR